MKEIKRLKELYCLYREKKCSKQEVELFFDLLGRYYFSQSETLQPIQTSQQQVSNEKEAFKIFCLTDGTRVKLGPGSRLIYPEIFKGLRRYVSLEGTGFFEVAAHPGYPFVVQTGSVSTNVQQGSFNISAVEGACVEVCMYSGTATVTFEKGDYNRKISVRTQQQVVLDPMRGEFCKTNFSSVND